MSGLNVLLQKYFYNLLRSIDYSFKNRLMIENNTFKFRTTYLYRDKPVLINFNSLVSS